MGATVTGGSAVFDGTMQQYIDLPNGMLSEMGPNVTVEAWATYTPDVNNWSRIFDFGTTTLGEDPTIGGDAYTGVDSFFFAPRRGAGTANNSGRVTLNTANAVTDLDENVAGTPPANEEFHIAAVVNYDQRRLEYWINGVLLGARTITYNHDPGTIDDVNNWFGRSQYSGDSFLNGSINEVRMYKGVRTPIQIALGAGAGPG
jgi:hypothetical protein